MLSQPHSAGALRLSHGFWSEPFHGIPPCGDAAAMVDDEHESWLLVLDAIGHGLSAAQIAHRLVVTFQHLVSSQPRHAGMTPSVLLGLLHRQLGNSKQDEQAAVGLFHFNRSNTQLDAVLVGNLEAMLLTPKGCSRLHSQNGMVGGRLPQRLQTQSHALSHDSVLAVFSDGIRLREAAAVLPQHVYGDRGTQSLSVLARALVHDYRRDYDDSCCALVWAQRLSHD